MRFLFDSVVVVVVVSLVLLLVLLVVGELVLQVVVSRPIEALVLLRTLLPVLQPLEGEVGDGGAGREEVLAVGVGVVTGVTP